VRRAIFARFMKDERLELIANRAQVALAAKKAHGAALGDRTNLAEAQTMDAAANRATADAFTTNVLPVVRELQASGTTTTRAIAKALNACGIRTARSGTWHHSTVRNLLAREE
jgi:recombinase